MMSTSTLKDRRKLQGVHYTPEPVARFIAKKAFSYFRRGVGHGSHALPCVLDPACGEGVFLVAAFDELCRLQETRAGRRPSPEEGIELILSHLLGLDVDSLALAGAGTALARKVAELAEFPPPARQVAHWARRLTAHLHACDALGLKTDGQATLFDSASTPLDQYRERFDIVLGNPPYVRTQHMSPARERDAFRGRFATARGRFDLSSLFIELAFYMLRPGGLLAFIVTNKFLATNAGDATRAFLRKRFRMLYLLDLGDTRFFEAAVLPLVLIAKRDGSAKATHVQRVRQVRDGQKPVRPSVDDIGVLMKHLEKRGQSRLGEIVRVRDGRYALDSFRTKAPFGAGLIHHPDEAGVIAALREKGQPLGVLCERIIVGIKTTADDVFINAITPSFVRHQRLESAHIHPLIQSHNVHRWRVDWRDGRDSYILYPYVEVNGKVQPVPLTKVPRIARYLESHRRVLAGRAYIAEAGRQWYEIWVPQRPAYFEKMKIITPDISDHNRFAVDMTGRFVNGTCFVVVPSRQHERWLYYLLAVLNSPVLEFYQKVAKPNSLYAGRYRYWTSSLSGYPIPPYNAGSDDAIVRCIRSVVAGGTSPDDLERVLPDWSYGKFGLTPRQVAIVRQRLAIG